MSRNLHKALIFYSVFLTSQSLASSPCPRKAGFTRPRISQFCQLHLCSISFCHSIQCRQFQPSYSFETNSLRCSIVPRKLQSSFIQLGVNLDTVNSHRLSGISFREAHVPSKFSSLKCNLIHGKVTTGGGQQSPETKIQVFHLYLKS